MQGEVWIPRRSAEPLVPEPTDPLTGWAEEEVRTESSLSQKLSYGPPGQVSGACSCTTVLSHLHQCSLSIDQLTFLLKTTIGAWHGGTHPNTWKVESGEP